MKMRRKIATLVFFQAEDGIRDKGCDWSSDVCSSDLASLIHHDGNGVFAGVPSPFSAIRYHSLCAAPDAVPGPLEVTARSDSGVIMAVRHREYPVYGVQFHPESILTEY